MRVLALNCGSSSVKFRLFVVDERGDGEAKALGGGLVERIGGAANLVFEQAGRSPLRETAPIADHEVAVRRVLDWVRQGATSLDAVGHRVVHGGERFIQPTLIDGAVAGALEALEELAPLHNGPSLAGIRACRAALGDPVPLVAVFDTAFHTTLPEHAYAYGIPHELAKRHGIRRYLAVLGGARAVVFTGGIGEHSPEVRAEICRGGAWFGLALDAALNDQMVGRPGRISAIGATLEAWVIPTDEEQMVARETTRCLAVR